MIRLAETHTAAAAAVEDVSRQAAHSLKSKLFKYSRGEHESSERFRVTCY